MQKHARKAATLVELIFVIVIISVLSVASFKAMQAITIREYKAKETTKLTMEAQVAIDIISNYLSARVPYTTIGYEPSSGDFEYIGDLTQDRHVLEWLGMAQESRLNGAWSGFVDMATKDGSTFYSPDTDGDAINTDTQNKFNTSNDSYNDKLVNLIFAGSFDRAESSSSDYNDSFGWHGNASNDAFDITIDNDGNITITDSVEPEFLYEKYFLVDSAYAIARGEDIDQSAACITALDLSDINNTLLLFSNYRPWRGETFCADSSGTQEGNVTVLMQNISGFSFEESGRTVRIYLDINKSIRGASPLHFSKMKVVF